MTFEELNLSAPLLRAVHEVGYTTPSPIQGKAIPPVLAGQDLMGCAQTGTGKTAAFALPMLQRLSGAAPRKKGAVRALILTPTRELALQIGQSFEDYGKYVKISHTVIFGGVGQAPQVAALKKGVDVVVACPGRLNDLIGQGFVDIGNLEIFVLDEADRMLDMGFVHDVKKVIAKLPKVRQNLMFSATMPSEIEQLAKSILHDPAFVKVDPVSSTVERIQQSLYFVEKGNKRELLPYLIKTLTPAVTSALVFSRTKHGADKIVKDLEKQGIRAAAIHGNKSQNARVTALEDFKAGKTRVLVATDIAARGIDISELAYVFNYDLPEVPETYVHRIGRTARAGADGMAVSFCAPEEREYLAGIEKLNRKSIPVVSGHPWDGKPAPAKAPAPLRGRRPAAAPVQAAPKQESVAPAPEKRGRGVQKKIFADLLGKEETVMDETTKCPAEGEQGEAAKRRRRRRRRPGGQAEGAAQQAPNTARAENAAPAQPEKAAQGNRNGRGPVERAPRAAQSERGTRPATDRTPRAPRQGGRPAQPQKPKFDPRFLTSSAAQTVQGSAPAPRPSEVQAAREAAQAPRQENGRRDGGRPRFDRNDRRDNRDGGARNARPAAQQPAARPQRGSQGQNAQSSAAPQTQQSQQPRRDSGRGTRGGVRRDPKDDDPGLVLISRRPPQQKFTSFDDYMDAHGGATAPIEDHTEE